jgi:hypothetical protein
MYVVLACNLVELVILDVSGLVRFTEEGIMMNMNEHQQMNTNKHGMMLIYMQLPNLRGRSGLPWLLHFSGHLSLLYQCNMQCKVATANARLLDDMGL